MKMVIRTFERILTAALILIISSSIAGCGMGGTTTGGAIKEGPIKIGFVGPLSGSQAPFGQSEVEALTMEAEEINGNGGISGRQIELIVEDDRMDPATAVTAVKKLIETDEVVAIVGDLQSGCTMAIAPIAEQAKVPMVTPIATSPAVSDAGDYVFRTMPGTETQAELLARVLTQRGFNKIAGYGVQVSSITDEGERIVVRVKLTRPQAMAENRASQPYHVVRCPHTAKNVVFKYLS